MKFEQPEQKFSIEQQFKNPDIIDIEGKNLEVVDIRPEYQKTEVPTILAPGWTGTPEMFRDNIIDLAKLNRRVISINAPHGVEIEENRENIPNAEFRKIAALEKIIKKKKLEKVDIVSNSEGGFYATVFASLHPEKIRNLVLIDPVGIIGKDNLKRLMIDFSADVLNQSIRGIKDSQAREGVLRLSKESVKSMIKNPVQAVKQILAISNSDIREKLKELKNQDIGISVIHAVDDKAFPMERVQKVVNTNQVDGFYSIKGTHNEIILNHERCSELIDKALDDLEKKYAKD